MSDNKRTGFFQGLRDLAAQRREETDVKTREEKHQQYREMAQRTRDLKMSQFKREVLDDCEDFVLQYFQTPEWGIFDQAFMKYGYFFNLEQFNCRLCPGNSGLRGAYHPEKKEISLCANNLRAKDYPFVLSHELVHAYDDIRTKNMDWNDCKKVMCSEIRAYHLSRECQNVSNPTAYQKCIQEGVKKSLNSEEFNVTCEDGFRGTMEDIFLDCFNDNSPILDFLSSRKVT
mmetsp:Transcript_65008/g.74728  ORF Transcript_65008/g.74728 Transcript_65008/m.74728 type:complete len:230 (+) Transcript_65008:27-716(+)